MASEQQIAANRRNAQRSTGPQTPEGRRAASMNALKFGFFSTQTLFPNEDPAEYRELLDSFLNHYRPANPADYLHVETAVSLAWRSRRHVVAETAAQIEMAEAFARVKPGLPSAQCLGAHLALDAHASARYARISRVGDTLQRALSRALAEVERIQPGDPPPAETPAPALAEVIPFPVTPTSEEPSTPPPAPDKTNPIPILEQVLPATAEPSSPPDQTNPIPEMKHPMPDFLTPYIPSPEEQAEIQRVLQYGTEAEFLRLLNPPLPTFEEYEEYLARQKQEAGAPDGSDNACKPEQSEPRR